MANKKRLATTVGAMALTAVLAIGGTLAYLSQVTETKKNMFTGSDNIITDLTEEHWDENKQYIPGEGKAKDPVISNDEKSGVDVYTAVKLEFYDNDGAKISYNEFKTLYGDIQYKTADGFASGVNPAAWKIDSGADSANGLFVQYIADEGVLAKGTSTKTPVFDQVLINYGITKTFNKTYSTTTQYEALKDEAGNYVLDANGKYQADKTKPITSTSTEPVTETKIIDTNGNVLTDVFTLPSFQIDVTGYAVQATDSTKADKGLTELKKLAGL